MGKRPSDSPSLADDENEFQRIADRLWGKKAASNHGMLRVGKGRVYAGASANEALADLGVARDFEYTKPEPDTTLMSAHRKLDDGEIYFVDNHAGPERKASTRLFESKEKLLSCGILPPAQRNRPRTE